ncbi:MAG TPA: hypothetical protein VMI92_06355 [Steroidobacteraceae bacterium]|nr:hypothetical protein [Steroidobacteraceae bacterium]
MAEFTVAARFCGPPGCANGGYFCGLVAAAAGRSVQVRLERPVPLERALRLGEVTDGQLGVFDGTERVALVTAAALQLAAPPAPDYLQALEASRRFIGFGRHAFPNCFVCGTDRARGDGLRVFAGQWGESVAAPWVPDASLDQGDGKVAAEFMWAALDCPGYFAARSDGVPMLLGEFNAHVDRRVHVSESCVVVGWRLGVSGRKYEAGTALFDEDGELCGRARALWIEPRNSPGAA